MSVRGSRLRKNRPSFDNGRSWLRESVAVRVGRGRRTRRDAETPVEVGDVSVHRMLADNEPCGDLTVGQAGSKQSEDLELLVT